MPRTVSAGYFREGVWAATGPIGLRRHTCLECGTRLKTWPAFRAHRALCRVVPAEVDWDALRHLALQEEADDAVAALVPR